MRQLPNKVFVLSKPKGRHSTDLPQQMGKKDGGWTRRWLEDLSVSFSPLCSTTLSEHTSEIEMFKSRMLYSQENPVKYTPCGLFICKFPATNLEILPQFQPYVVTFWSRILNIWGLCPSKPKPKSVWNWSQWKSTEHNVKVTPQHHGQLNFISSVNAR